MWNEWVLKSVGDKKTKNSGETYGFTSWQATKKSSVREMFGNYGYLTSLFYNRGVKMSVRVKDIELIMESARLYQENLADKNLLVIYLDRLTNKYVHVEFIFYKSSFLHLTGVIYKGSTSDNQKSVQFLDKCLSNKLSLDEVAFRSDGTTRLKLEILRDVVSIHKHATMIGDYNKNRPTLLTEKVYGNCRVCVGTVRNKGDYYVPNTALREDIRKIVSYWNPIKAILIKSIKEKKYNLSDLAKKSNDFNQGLMTEEIAKLINVDCLV